MDTTSFTTIDKIVEAREDLSLRVTLKSRSEMKTWNRNKNSGSMITGILMDNTGSIDFVCWTEAAQTYDQMLKANNSYRISNVKAAIAKESFSRSNHKCQITINKFSVIEKDECVPFVPPLLITPIADLQSKLNYDKVTVFGKVIAIPPPEKLSVAGADIVKARIQDNTGTIQLSFIGNEIQRCDFSINDTLLLENAVLRIYGPLRCLQGNTGTRSVNPTDRDFSKHMPNANQQTVDLSPSKTVPMQKTPDTLNKSDGRQTFQTLLAGTNIKDCVYDKCPRVQCRSRVAYLNNTLYRCNKCETDYFLATKGMRLILDIPNVKKERKQIVMFNEMAEKFCNVSPTEIASMDETAIHALEKFILSQEYQFTVGSSRADQTDGEFVCESFHLTPTQQTIHETQQNPCTSGVKVISCGPEHAGIPICNDTKPSTSKCLDNVLLHGFAASGNEGNLSIGKDTATSAASNTLSVQDPLSASGNEKNSDDDKFPPVDVEGPLDLSFSDNLRTDIGSFDLRMDIPEDSSSGSNSPLDLSQSTIQEPIKKKYKFKKRLFPDMS